MATSNRDHPAGVPAAPTAAMAPPLTVDVPSAGHRLTTPKVLAAIREAPFGVPADGALSRFRARVLSRLDHRRRPVPGWRVS